MSIGRWVQEVIWPALGCDPAGLVYQGLPTVRCHLPGTGRPLIRKHNDAEYFHQPNEMNVWLPVTKTFGSNTLWSESSPGEGDFHPFECEGDHPTTGQCVLFVSTVDNITRPQPCCAVMCRAVLCCDVLRCAVCLLGWALAPAYWWVHIILILYRFGCCAVGQCVLPSHPPE